jgi:hypothetical protein
MSLIGKPLPQKICEKWAKMSPSALDVMNIHDVYARICMPATPSDRVACRSTGTWYLVNTGRTRKVGCVITDFRTAGHGKFKFGVQVGRPTTARRTPDRTQIIWGMCLITDFGAAGRGKFKFGMRVDDTGFSTAHGEWDRNNVWSVVLR